MTTALRRGSATLVILAIIVWSATGTEFHLAKLRAGIPYMADFLARTWPPNAGALGPAWHALVETVQIAVVGTVLGVALALLLSVPAARNMVPLLVFPVARSVLTLIRTVPSIVWALFFVAGVGLGPFAGILATALYTVGFVGKLFYEAVEAVEPGVPEAVTATGARGLHVWRYGVLPQVMPHLIGHSLYAFEYNVRAATVLGIVGAGGVGFYLLTYMRTFQYDMAATVVLLTLGVVLVIDGISLLVRRRFV